jgi:nucleotide-binding universal stress UspA family protein
MIENSSSGVKNLREDSDPLPNSDDDDYYAYKRNFPLYTKILVPDDGTWTSGRALIYAIYLSNLSGAEIVILRMIKDTENLRHTSINASQYKEPIDNEKDFKRSIEGKLVDAMEEKIKKCIEVGSKNKISYEFRTGRAIDGIIDACQETNYDLIVMAASELDYSLRSSFNEARKITSNISTPVLLIH